MAVSPQPSGICLSTEGACEAATSSCPERAPSGGGTNCEVDAFHQSSTTVLDSTAISALGSSIDPGVVLGIDVSHLAPLGGLSSRTVSTLRLVTAGSSGWTYSADVTQTSAGHSLQLRASFNSGGRITLGSYTLSGAGFHLQASRKDAESTELDLCLANAAGDCIAAAHTLELATATTPVLVETGVLNVSTAPSQCEAVHFSARDL